MSILIVNLFDRNFTYNLEEIGYITSTKTYKPKKIVWEPGKINTDKEISVFTDFFLKREFIPLIRSVKTKYKVAWLVEPSSIHSDCYEEIKYMFNEFDLVLSNHHDITRLAKKTAWVPGCGSWIDLKNWKVFEKEKDVCIIASSKNFAPGHILRHQVIKSFGDNIDVYGKGYNPFPEKDDILKKYRFSIEIENCQKENYFTEKLLDCFAVGTIPVYWGPKGINEHFDLDGIITFSNIEDLYNKFSLLTKQNYEKKLHNVKNNLKLAEKFSIMDDYVANILKERLLF